MLLRDLRKPTPRMEPESQGPPVLPFSGIRVVALLVCGGGGSLNYVPFWASFGCGALHVGHSKTGGHKL